MSRPLSCALAAALVLTSTLPSLARSSADLLHELHQFSQTGRVLYVAAHPDDENTRLITYLARGRGYETGYLSLTRGDGGQNLIGAELRDGLGVIRTQELLAARRIDGGVQFFSRANDFGFSKTAEETLATWDKDEVLADMVRVIRTFRPDVIITRFSPEPGGTHGHHTASAQLAIEAVKLAADPSALREQLPGLAPWQARRVVWNAWVGRGGVTPEGLLALDVGGYDPLVGESFGEIAARSRTQHKSQGFGALSSRGSALEHFRHLAGEPATEDLMDGVETTWRRVPGGERIGELAAKVLAKFQPREPHASLPDLLELHRLLADAPKNPLTHEKREQLEQIIAGVLGLDVMTTVEQADAIPGETLKLRHTAIVRQPVAVTWRAVELPRADRVPADQALETNRSSSIEGTHTLPANATLTHPYWLRQPGTPGLFAVDDPALIGRPENPPELPVRFVFEVEGRTFTVPSSPVQISLDPVRGEIRRPLRVVAPVTVAMADELQVFSPGEQRTVPVDVRAVRTGARGSARLAAPEGWTISPQQQPFTLGEPGSATRLYFQVTAPSRPASGTLRATAEINGQVYGNRRYEIAYEHIPVQLLQPPAVAKVVSIELAIGGRRIGYVPGAGDAVPEALARMGYEVTTLDPADLSREMLAGFDAVVLGVRALNTQAQLAPRLPELHAYAAAGGTVLMQYNTTQPLPATIAPYRLRVSRDRVTEEDAPVTLLAPEHPALTRPNRITSTDFDGWVQERGLYFPDHWDAPFVPLLAAADTGDPLHQGALLVAPHGRGWIVYTGLSFFRQLPEGVPGAYRLLANLVSLSASSRDAQTADSGTGAPAPMENGTSG